MGHPIPRLVGCPRLVYLQAVEPRKRHLRDALRVAAVAAAMTTALATASCAGTPVAGGTPSGARPGGGAASAAPGAGTSEPGAVAVPAPSPESEARAALARFTEALRGGRWAEAWSLLSGPWRARATPERLAADWRESGPVGPRAVARVDASLAAGVPVRLRADGRAAFLPVGEGKGATLLLEDGAWRVDALE
jgi:hypothetical protein